MKLTSFFDAILGDAPKAYVPLGLGLSYAQAEQVRLSLREVAPGFVLRLHFDPTLSQRRWWLVIERESQPAERVSPDA